VWTAHNTTANHTNLGSDLRNFDGNTEVQPEINLPTGITVPDQSSGEEEEDEGRPRNDGSEYQFVSSIGLGSRGNRNEAGKQATDRRTDEFLGKNNVCYMIHLNPFHKKHFQYL
jgi:hypothetical protein